MKRLALAIGLAAMVAVMGLNTALAATTISAGNSISDQANSDSWGKFFLVDTGTQFAQGGTVSSWKVWAENTNRVQLVIYSHTGSDRATGWTAIGNSPIETPTVGENTFSIPTPIGVNAGSYIGLYFPDNDGSVSFGLSPSNAPFLLNGFGGRVLVTAESASAATAFVDSSDRIYSLRAFGTATEASNGDDEDDEDDTEKDKPEKDKDGINGNGRNFGTHLSGDESQAQGQASFKLSKDGDFLKFKLNVANIENVVFAGLYKDTDGDDEADGALVAKLFDDDSNEGRFQGTLAEGVITEDLEDLMKDIRAGNVYVAVATDDNDPEILGWLMAKGHGEDGDDEDADASSVSNDDSGEDDDEDDSEHLRGWEKHEKEMKEKKEKKDE